MTNLYGLIGKTLSHSFSPEYFEQKFKKESLDAEYRLFELDNIAQLPELIKIHPNLKGLNVTIPFKTEVLPFLDELDEVAKQTSSVNTIRIEWKNDVPFLKGFNTDVIGFEQSLVPFIGERKVLQALILGTGGSAQAVAFVLTQLGIEFVFVSRNPGHQGQIAYTDITKAILDSHKLIIQTTPLGMFPDVDNAPAIPYEMLGENHLLFDLVYNPSETLFMKRGKQKGARVINGQKMLEIQAEASWKIWNTKVSFH